MALQSPFKLLEINIISAQDLPPVSKMLRTFAVAYIHPDHKLTTRIDHAGHTNPTWNYKVSFHVDEKFLKQESSFITIEIYNLAWLRDLPIGTTRLLVSSLSPPLRKNPGFRRVSLQICRPSGHLQGTLNLGVQLVDNTAPSLESGLSPIRNDEEIDEEEEKEDVQEMKQERFEDFEDEKEKNRGPSSRMTSKSGSICTSPDSRITGRPETETETRTGYVTSCNSLFSVMRPLPSEVAVDMKRGVYSTEWNDYGSSIFDNWSTDKSSDCHRVVEEPMDIVEWPTEDQIPLTTITNDDDKKKTGVHRPRRGAGKKKGLFSCFFGSGYGFQFSIICGSKKNKNKNKNTKNKNRNVSKQNVHLVTLPADQDNLHRFYV
ncbi:hypothetical protein ABFS82_06G198200 [Erythranthe guttata]|uniref:uncharacterized protein LOC105955305 n=1 Tax=Erythranthe guttata TaxID=4155 RepID=UPI00064DA4A5|nr:PREDICTED: uncharacterized protein LOC105955305 [Erythranthe guttata]|eukprot:XP_012834476.1 PREDICTED: uncharacterized protein LOC105955305 [Erythranthe guttata]